MKTATAVAVAAAMCLSSVEEANAAGHAAAIAALKWNGSKNGVCGAYNDVNDYTMVGVGPCNPDDQKKAPYAYTWQKAVGTAITTDDTTYLTAPVLKTDGDKKQNVQLLSANTENAATKNGYIDFANKKSTVGEYSYVMTGNLFGSKTMGAYLGMASYLNTGTKTIKTRTNDIYGAGFDARAYKDNSATGGSKYGAPAGPYTMCISDKVAGKTDCTGAEREFTPGAYKFSIYGATMGTNYVVPTLDAGKAKYLGVRMLMGVTVDKTKLKGSYDLAFNKGTKTLDNIGTDDVTDMTVTYCDTGAKCHKETFTFPTKYNTGSTVTVPAAGTAFPLAETKTIKIKASHVKDKDGKNVADEMYVDYLMEIPTKANEYLIYDPDVKSSTVDASDVPPSAGGTKGEAAKGSAGFVSAQTSAVASVVAAVAAFFMM